MSEGRPLRAVPFDVAPRRAVVDLLEDLVREVSAGELEGLLVVLRTRQGVTWRSAGITNADAVLGATIAVNDIARGEE